MTEGGTFLSRGDHPPSKPRPLTPAGSSPRPGSHHSFLPPGKPYGADDFLPVLMYVLARSNLTEMLLSVEYMMELMDPALQLGEGESAAPTRARRHCKPLPRPRHECAASPVQALPG